VKSCDNDDLVALCEFDALAENSSRGFAVETPSGVMDLFLVRRGDQVFAYRNSCPHTGGPLEWVPDRFLNRDGDLIQCATHDALFRIHDGLCVAGPCAGQALGSLPVVIRRGMVCLQV
jgi:nitrite reductase/ring-hydroxylating ferredoxin subunit